MSTDRREYGSCSRKENLHQAKRRRKRLVSPPLAQPARGSAPRPLVLPYILAQGPFHIAAPNPRAFPGGEACPSKMAANVRLCSSWGIATLVCLIVVHFDTGAGLPLHGEQVRLPP